MAKSKQLNTTHCYIRAATFGKLGVHRIGAIALGTTNDPTKVRVAFSVCHTHDRFDKRQAVTKAVARLNSEHESVILDRNAVDIILNSGVTTALNRRNTSERFFMDSYIKGALNDLA